MHLDNDGQWRLWMWWLATKLRTEREWRARQGKHRLRRDRRVWDANRGW